MNYPSGGRRVNKDQFLDRLTRQLIDVAMAELEQRARGAAGATALSSPKSPKRCRISLFMPAGRTCSRDYSDRDYSDSALN